MTKPVVNNKIIYQNIYGRVALHDEFLEQSVRKGDSPTFASLQLTGDATIEGNLYVQGNTTILGTNVIEFEDNIILLNRLETGSGVTLNQSGLEIERGILENYRIVYNELDGTLRTGLISNLQAVATREDAPLTNGIMMWNNVTKRIDARNVISNDIYSTTTTNSTSTTSGSVYLYGGIGIVKDATIGGQLSLIGSNNTTKSFILTDSTSNTLLISSPFDISFLPSESIRIPFNKKLGFGNTEQSISSNALTKDLNIQTIGDINFYLENTKRISIPNQIPITFSTQNEKIYADSSNNMVVTGRQNIELIPGANKKVLIPVNIGLAFYNENQQISANLSNDLTMVAGNNIYLTPGPTLNVQIPTNNSLKFGATGNQKISANSNNELFISSTNDINVSTSSLNIPNNIPITFGSSSQYIKSNSAGSLLLDANINVTILKTAESSSPNTGALVVNGGVGIQKNLYVGGDLFVQGNTVTLETQTIVLEDNLIVVNSTPLPAVDGGLAIKRFSDGVSDTTGNTFALAFYKESTDEFTFAYSNTQSSSLVSITDYIPVRSKAIHLVDTSDAVDFTSGSLSTLGGAYIDKHLVVNQNITCNSIWATQNGFVNHFSTTTSSIGTLTISSTTNANANSSSGAFILQGGGYVSKNVHIGGNVFLTNTSPSTLVLTGGISILNTEKATSNSNGNGITVAGGVGISKNLYVGQECIVQGELRLSSTENATSLSNGGTFTNFGGQSISKNLLVGGDLSILSTTSSTNTSSGSLVLKGGAAIGENLHVVNNVYINQGLHLKNNSLFDSINNDSVNSLWSFLGQIDNYCFIELTNRDFSLNFGIAVSGTNVSFSHSQFGTNNGANLIVYKHTSNYYLFSKTPPNSISYLRVSSSNPFNIVSEGTLTEPNGTTSGYTNLWSQEYSTSNNNTLSLGVGNFFSDGTQFHVHDNTPIFGYNASSSRDLGLFLQRYQKSNDLGQGDVVADANFEIVTLPDQASANMLQVKLSSFASSSNDFYNGWWLKVTSGANANQIRQITSYNGAQRVATLSQEWTSQKPLNGDTIALYGHSYATLFYDKNDNQFKLGYAGDSTLQSYADLAINGLNMVSTVASSNSSTGSFYTLGGISINNTNDASSFTRGGSFTTNGGAAINKKLFVGQNICVGEVQTPLAAIHITQPHATVALESSQGISYIDFVNSQNNTRFGILNNATSNSLSLTLSTSGSTPLLSSELFTITSQGNIGIGVTSSSLINSLLTLQANQYISTDSTTGFLGLSSSSIGSRLELYNSGNVEIYTGSTGSLNVFCNSTSANVLRVNQDSVQVYSTSYSQSSTSGALVVSGGVSISTTKNCESLVNGGALTVAGGASISKDIFIGGNIYVSGNLNVTGSAIIPSIAFSNTQGCAVTSYGNNKYSSVSNLGTLSFYVEVTPTLASQNCQFEFTLPERSSNFEHRGELVSICTGYTNDTDIIPLFNTISVGVKNAPRGLLKFHSVSTSIHYFTIICRYTTG
jgi:hypothetical protein